MNCVILCVGRLKEKFFRDAAGEYLKRLSRYGKIEIWEVNDEPEPANASDADRQKVMEKEGEGLLKRIRPEDHVTALCIRAKQKDSLAFAKDCLEVEESGKRQVFVIGGSLGLANSVLKRADEKLSVSDMTFPHQLFRIMLLEQIYRACKICAGERYHK